MLPGEGALHTAANGAGVPCGEGMESPEATSGVGGDAGAPLTPPGGVKGGSELGCRNCGHALGELFAVILERLRWLGMPAPLTTPG